VRFAGFAEAARRLFIGLFILLAGSWAWREAAAQNTEAQSSYTQGLQALQERRYDDARTALLQAVQADPSFAGAWLDLAIATQAAGDAVQAEEFLTILETRFAPLPEPVAQSVAGLRQRIQERSQAQAGQAVVEGWRWRKAVQVGGGYDTNANAGLSLTDLTLTLPGGSVLLPLAPGLRPAADGYLTAAVAADGKRRLGEGQLEVAASLRHRNNRQLNAFDTLELLAGAGYSGNGPAFEALSGVLPGPWRAGAVVQQLQLGGHGLLNSLMFSGIHAWANRACAPQASVDLDFRTYPAAANLDSRTLWLNGGISCPSPWTRFGGTLGATVRAGYEDARHDFMSLQGRPGDDTRHFEATLTHQWSWAGVNGTHKLDAQLQWAGAWDTQGYSPLLGDNAARQVKRAAIGLVYGFPLQAGVADDQAWMASLALQGFRQRSNLEVFRLRGQVAQLTLQKSW
jgi:hypothetical protein